MPLVLRWNCINNQLLARQRYHGRIPKVYKSVIESHATRFQGAARKEQSILRWLRPYPVPRGEWLPASPFWELGHGVEKGYEFACEGRKADWTEAEVAKKFWEIAGKHRAAQRLFCYTDGSKTDTGVGTAFWIPQLGVKGGGSMDTWRAIVSAELAGIKMVVEWLIARKYAGEVVIFTDSKSAVQALLSTRKVSERCARIAGTYLHS